MLSLALVVCAGAVAAYDWENVEAGLRLAIDAKVFPGCVAGVATSEGTVFLKSFGSFAYSATPPYDSYNPETTNDTRYDLASLTKVTTTTSAVALLYQRGDLDIFTPVTTYLGSAYAANGKATITPRNLLLHNAGYPPDPVPGYWDEAFGCPNTKDYHPNEDFSCVNQVFPALLNQTLINPVGAKYVYSDLSFITLHFIVGGIVQEKGYVKTSDLLPACQAAGVSASGAPDGLTRSCYYEAFVRTHVFEPLGMTSTGFLPPKSVWASVSPTWDDETYRHEVVQGQVSDENSYALGGIAGHAGVFSTVPDIMILVKRLLFAPENPTDGFLNKTTVTTFTTVKNVTQSSRAYGWDTNAVSNTYRGCDKLSDLTFTHTGYTGTQICADPTRNLITILFTNRVYPNKTGQMDTIHTTRQKWNDNVLAAIEAGN